MANSSLSNRAYRHIQRQLTAGELLPGAIVSEKRLALELGISRTPVGQAIRQLVSEGLMEQVPRFGTVVREITRKDLEELYELREAMEPYAALKAASLITELQLKQLQVLCKTIEQLAAELESSEAVILEGKALRDFLSADLAFHLYILRASNNERMLKIVRESRFVSQVFRFRRAGHDIGIVRAACECHQKILDALKARDGEKARSLMYEHIRVSKEQSLAHLDRDTGGSMSSDSSLGLELSDGIREALARVSAD